MREIPGEATPATSEELLRLYYTHPDEMTNASRRKQHDNLHRQISTFQKLLQHAMSRFSIKKLYNMLCLAADYQSNHRNRMSPVQISSLSELSEIVDNVKSGVSGRGLQPESDVQLLKYFDTYFDDIRYLKDLKKNFDERIYMCLFDYFYDPSGDPKEKSEHRQPSESEDSGAESAEIIAGEALDDNPEDEVEITVLNEKEKLLHAVKEMYRLNKKWHRLLNDDDLDISLFDPDSHHEILQFPDFGRFENILRYVPDLFVKAYKSIEIAKLWWTQANKVYIELPGIQGPTYTGDGFQKKILALEDRLAKLAADISQLESELADANEDMQRLKSREYRTCDLETDSEKAEELKNELDKKYKSILEKKEHLEDELHLIRDTRSSRYRQTNNQLQVFRRQLLQVENEISLMTYHIKILKEDFHVEVDSRPDMIRYMTQVEETTATLMQALQQKRLAKELGEKQLNILKLNCQRMREVMEHVDGRSTAGTQYTGDRSQTSLTGDRSQTSLSTVASEAGTEVSIGASEYSNYSQGNANNNNSAGKERHDSPLFPTKPVMYAVRPTKQNQPVELDFIIQRKPPLPERRSRAREVQEGRREARARSHSTERTHSGRDDDESDRESRAQSLERDAGQNNKGVRTTGVTIRNRDHSQDRRDDKLRASKIPRPIKPASSREHLAF